MTKGAGSPAKSFVFLRMMPETITAATPARIPVIRALKKALEDLGFHVLDGQANYLCFRAEGDRNLTERLLNEGILLRSCGNYRGLGEDYYRTAVRGREENERLLEALGKVVGQT